MDRLWSLRLRAFPRYWTRRLVASFLGIEHDETVKAHLFQGKGLVVRVAWGLLGDLSLGDTKSVKPICIAALLNCAALFAQTLEVASARALLDETITIRALGLQLGERVTIRAPELIGLQALEYGGPLRQTL